MKKFLAIVLTIVMSLSLVCLFIACGEKESSDNSSVSVKKIENIGDYAIIRSSDATDTVAKSASSLSADLLRKLDTKVISTTDSKNESTCEILVGKTLRKIDGVDYNSIGLNEYIIKLVDKKIVIAGGSDKATIDAVDFFISNLVSEDGVRVPTGNGYSYEDTAAYKSIKIDGTSISEYTILTNNILHIEGFKNRQCFGI